MCVVLPQKNGRYNLLFQQFPTFMSKATIYLPYTFYRRGMWITWLTDTMQTGWNASKNIMVFISNFTKLHCFLSPSSSWQNMGCFMILRSRAGGWQREEDGKNGCHISGSPYICHKKTHHRSHVGTLSFVLALGCRHEQATSKVLSLMLSLVHKPWSHGWKTAQL